MEVAQASVTGVFRMILIIIGALVVLRFIGQLMNAKRNMEEERELNRRQRAFDEEARRKRKNLGKTNILKKGQRSGGHVEDVDFEEIE